MPPLVPLFDFDGTLVDSDAALVAPFVRLGIEPRDLPPLGLPLGAACAQVGVTVDAYLAHYDAAAAQPFPGVPELLRELARWGLASNKDGPSGRAELARLGWEPERALFSDDFGGAEKRLAPLLEALGLEARDAVFIGDTDHDRACAAAAGVPFALAGWNPRARRSAQPGERLIEQPAGVLALCTRN